MSEFGFKVIQCHDFDMETCRPKRDPNGKWCVALPHQCDDWTITRGADYLGGEGHAEAVASLELFISEAQEALAALKARQEHGDHDKPRT